MARIIDGVSAGGTLSSNAHDVATCNQKQQRFISGSSASAA